ncbi:peptidase M24, structural domain-containing protein [Gilbertella persicaria]|uniref:peptidase M24, structural domain-containing protein n=1 Tax=Gilbertella persicaria TaxID=101096 RepID=UPI00221E8099|nr:peptidase M24, structural domain-containing protein [Gilbertella persicaria]KAI8085968.1 peptidase M24, structural domain-containing protein [Gilbertella persicaria]
MEGGASMVYYTNIEWGLTERAFMVVLELDDEQPTGICTTIVTPAFEATRALESLKHANLPEEIRPRIVEWLEYDSPFDAVKSVFDSKKQYGKLFVEQDARLFIYQGIADSLKNHNVEMASRSIRMLRMIKSVAELDIMRCASTVTEMAIRTVRPHIKVGMTEFDIQNIMEDALHKAGLKNTWVLALVDENAALPHGSSSTKKVTEHSTVLIDTGGELLGYQSDTTRTFFMGKRGHNQTIEDAWYLVRRAQENVLNRVGVGMTCAEVDLTARQIIDKGGYAEYFTHRLGHGIGLLMHEDPYMNQGNIEQYLAPGMTFSVEPGIYITNEFGIRLEDIVVVKEDGRLELLTKGLAQNPWTL